MGIVKKNKELTSDEMLIFAKEQIQYCELYLKHRISDEVLNATIAQWKNVIKDLEKPKKDNIFDTTNVKRIVLNKNTDFNTVNLEFLKEVFHNNFIYVVEKDSGIVKGTIHSKINLENIENPEMNYLPLFNDDEDYNALNIKPEAYVNFVDFLERISQSEKYEFLVNPKIQLRKKKLNQKTYIYVTVIFESGRTFKKAKVEVPNTVTKEHVSRNIADQISVNFPNDYVSEIQYYNDKNDIVPAKSLVIS